MFVTVSERRQLMTPARLDRLERTALDEFSTTAELLNEFRVNWAIARDKYEFINAETYLLETFISFVNERVWLTQGLWPQFELTAGSHPRLPSNNVYLTVQHGPYRAFPLWLSHLGQRVKVATDTANATIGTQLAESVAIENYRHYLDEVGRSGADLTTEMSRVAFDDVTSLSGIGTFLGDVRKGIQGILLLDGNRSTQYGSRHSVKFHFGEVSMAMNVGLLKLCLRMGVHMHLVLCSSRIEGNIRIPIYQIKKLPTGEADLISECERTITSALESGFMTWSRWESSLENIASHLTETI